MTSFEALMFLLEDNMKKIFVVFMTVLLSVVLTANLSAKGGQSGSSQGGKQNIRFLIWGEEQRVAYDRSLAEFSKVHPDINVDFQTLGWDEYWSKIQTEFAGGTGPDVFMNQTAYFLTLQNANAAEPLNDLIKRDNIDLSKYNKLALDIYTQNDKVYILPKDFDSVALIYNRDLFDRYGVPYPDDTLTWNPRDGGTFLELAKRMTIDVNGNNAASPRFDKNNIAIYGFLVQNATHAQVVNWNFIRMNGGDIMDYSNPRTIEAIQFLHDLMYKYYVAPPISAVQSAAPFPSGIISMYTEGSWNIWSIENQSNFNWGSAMLPKGPVARSSCINSIGPSVYTQSKYKEAAWELVKWIGSDTSQRIFGQEGVVFPGVSAFWDLFVNYWKGRNRDVSAFMTTFRTSDNFLTPMDPKYNEKEATITKNIDLVFQNRQTAQQAGAAIAADFAAIGK
jgi:multiple sugar transport system substrate-binding protein